MYRLYGAIGVLALIILITFSGFRFTTHTSSVVSSRLEQAFQQAQNGHITQAQQSMREAEALWDSQTDMMLLFVSHGKADEIETTLTTAASYLESESLPLFFADCQKALMLLSHFSSVEYPVINNIF